MNKLFKEYKSLVVFIIVVAICFIAGVYKDKKKQEIIRQETYKNCIKEADNYMREAMKDFDDYFVGNSMDESILAYSWSGPDTGGLFF